jgi:hypothetical protein
LVKLAPHTVRIGHLLGEGGMGKPNTAAYRTLGAFFRPVRPPDSDRPALPIVHALESFRGKLAPVEYPCLYCAKVCTSPQALATHGR